MKNNLKIVIISSITCLTMFLIIYLIFFLSAFIPKKINDINEENLLSKYYGTYELVYGNIKDLSLPASDGINKIKEQKLKIIINKENIRITNDMVNLAQNKFKLFKTDDQEVLFTGVHMLADYVDGHTDCDYQICFELIDNKLKQVFCPNSTSHFNVKNINLEYSKLN